MLIEEKNNQINEVMNKVFAYINTNLNLKKDLDDYYKAAGISKDNKRVLNNYTINYIFERKLGASKKSIFDYALEGLTDLTNVQKELLHSLNNTIDGVFEVRKITSGTFELFNITNEKLYVVKPMTKMVKFRNLSVGHILLARLLVLDNEYFLYHVVDHITYSNRVIGFQIAISRLAQDPSLFYFDNPEKLEQLKNNSKELFEKFNDIFSTDVVTTSNKYADTLINLLNEYIENGKKPTAAQIEKNTKLSKRAKYFDIEELREGKNLLLEAKKGFSSQSKEYNVSLIADEKSGLAVVPFFDIFLSIFESEDYKKIKFYKECVNKFVTDRHITPLALQIAYDKYKDEFIKRVNEILETKFKSLDEILHEYKQFYLDNPYTSSTLTLYSSYAFKRLLSVIEEAEEKNNVVVQDKKIKRNDLCPCGSGKKYKKCCGMAVQI